MTKTTVSTTIFDLTSTINIELNYYRPIAQGRKIFGELVPYRHIWRTGADGNTTIDLSEDIEINGKLLQKGKYAIFTIPNEERWQIIFYADYSNMGLPRFWNGNEIVLMTSVQPEKTQKYVESFTMGLNNLGNGEGSIDLAWENTFLEIRFRILNIKTLDASIVKEYRMANYYYSAAEFYYELRDLSTALLLITKSMEINEFRPFFYYRLRGLIEAGMGDLPSAIDSAKRSLVLSEDVGNEKYVQLNRQSILLWSTQIG